MVGTSFIIAQVTPRFQANEKVVRRMLGFCGLHGYQIGRQCRIKSKDLVAWPVAQNIGIVLAKVGVEA